MFVHSLSTLLGTRVQLVINADIQTNIAAAHLCNHTDTCQEL